MIQLNSHKNINRPFKHASVKKELCSQKIVILKLEIKTVFLSGLQKLSYTAGSEVTLGAVFSLFCHWSERFSPKRCQKSWWIMVFVLIQPVLVQFGLCRQNTEVKSSHKWRSFCSEKGKNSPRVEFTKEKETDKDSTCTHSLSSSCFNHKYQQWIYYTQSWVK